MKTTLRYDWLADHIDILNWHLGVVIKIFDDLITAPAREMIMDEEIDDIRRRQNSDSQKAQHQ